MEKEPCFLSMDQNIMVLGLTINKMEKENRYLEAGNTKLEFLIMASP